MTDDLFGKKDFGALFGYIQVFFTIAGSLGVIVSGFIYDVTQSYQMAWIFFLGLFIISMLSILLADYLNKKSLGGLDPLVDERIEEVR